MPTLNNYFDTGRGTPELRQPDAGQRHRPGEDGEGCAPEDQHRHRVRAFRPAAAAQEQNLLRHWLGQDV